MLKHATIETMRALKLHGMIMALESQLQTPEALNLSFDERLGMLVDTEMIQRDNRRLQARLKRATIAQTACIEDIDWRASRNIDRSTFSTLSMLQWILLKQNLLITGPTGTGKTYLSSALAQKACREGFTVQYQRASRLFKQLGESKITGTYAKLLLAISKTDLLIIDDFGLKVLNEEQRHDLLEIMEDRYKKHSTLVTSQLPIEHWHDAIGDPTIADAILDRLVHNAHTLLLKGDSLRKTKSADNNTTVDVEPAAKRNSKKDRNVEF